MTSPNCGDAHDKPPCRLSGSRRLVIHLAEAAARAPARLLNPKRLLLSGLLAAVLGAALSLAAWYGAHPALGWIVPVLVVLMPGRALAAIFLAAYVGAGSWPAPQMASAWFGSMAAGWGLWAGVLAMAALMGALFGGWIRRDPDKALLATLGLMLAWLLPPFGLVVPFHPLVSAGFALQPMHWLGVAMGMLLPPALACALLGGGGRHMRASRIVLITGMAALIVMGERPREQSPRVLGVWGAVSTRWGPPPEPNSLELMFRIQRMARLLEDTAEPDSNGDSLRVVAWPESTIGAYDPSLEVVLRSELSPVLARTGQTAIFGAWVPMGDGRWRNAALIMRPDGSADWLAARQTVPVAQWKPWAASGHFPSDWTLPSVVDVGGMRARVMFCFEEYMPLMHLLSELREHHHLVLGLASLWAGDGEAAARVQALHTQGMARMFSRSWLRAQNLPGKGAYRPNGPVGTASVQAMPESQR